VLLLGEFILLAHVDSTVSIWVWHRAPQTADNMY